MPFSYGIKVGDRLGSRTLTGIAPERDPWGQLKYQWICDCGNEGFGTIKAMRKTLYCPKCRPDNLPHLVTHGHSRRRVPGNPNSRTKLYDAWANMLQRTGARTGGRRPPAFENNPKFNVYRTVTVCPEWVKFEAFRDWAITNGYELGLSLDRVHPDRGYEPGNCEWITPRENARRVHQPWRRYHTPIEMFHGSGRIAALWD